MQEQDNYIKDYVIFWIWFMAVTIGFGLLYCEARDFLPELLASLFSPNTVLSVIENHSPLGLVLQVVFVPLVWWRFVKVLVFCGSPFPFGMECSSERSGAGGRFVYRMNIGDLDVCEKPNGYKGCFWYGAVFRTHSSSDKLMRSRLEFLILYLPVLKRTLVVHESRLFLRKETHEYRAGMYRRIFDEYVPKEDRHIKEIAERLRKIHEVLRGQDSVMLIDGLSWSKTRWSDGSSRVTDGFGNRLVYSHLKGEGKYRIHNFGPDNGDTMDLDLHSISELKKAVREHFDSV